MRDHKLLYGVYLRVGLLSSIIIIILLFLLVPYAQPEPYKLKRDIVTMVEEIAAQMEKLEGPPPAERPKVAIEAGSDVAAEEIVETIAATDFEEGLVRTSPTGPDIETVPYYKVEVKPKPIFQQKAGYPELARRAGIEGQSVVMALVDIDGSIMDVQILQSSGNQMLDEAALAAARQWKFTPAKQGDKFVRVYVSIPMNFRLVDSG
jgi:protein TonB